jgi:hypothetical protein
MAPNHVKTGRDPPRSCGGDEARRATEAPIDACFHEVAEALGQRGRRRRRCRSRRQAAVTGTAYDTARVAACGTKPATRASPTTRARQHDGGLSTRDSPPILAIRVVFARGWGTETLARGRRRLRLCDRRFATETDRAGDLEASGRPTSTRSAIADRIWTRWQLSAVIRPSF